jgi:hypothetical protein
MEPGWREHIDTATLDISDCRRCALGQLYGHYWDGLNEIGHDRELRYEDWHAPDLGFHGKPAEHESLRREWLHIIARGDDEHAG